MQILVVVDMQDAFLQRVYRATQVIHWVIQEIGLAKKHNNPVIVLEYDRYGDTALPLLRALKGCEVHFAVKSEDDGSKEVAHLMTVHSYTPVSVTVVGVNTEACVYATVRGLRTLYPDLPITVAVNGCSSGNWRLTQGPKNRHEMGVAYLRELPNVKLDEYVIPKHTAWSLLRWLII